ncbi:choice-of-anchor B family protein [Pilimelia anulata]|nr:choice-of-anchor B family protein [Pilimelia anulata]
MRTRNLGVVLGAIALAVAAAGPAAAHDTKSEEGRAEAAAVLKAYSPGWAAPQAIRGPVACTNGMIEKYPCKNVELLSFTPQNTIGGSNSSSSMWEWYDEQTKDEYVLFGRDNGISFVKVTDPLKPVYVGNLPSYNGVKAVWTDVRVYKNWMFTGKDSVNNGIQAFNLEKLRGVTSPQTFKEDAHYKGLTNSHTLWINQKTGFLYASGASSCNKGLTIIDIRDPKNMKQVACYSSEVYSHEALVWNYNGPDTRYTGKEIAFNFTGQGHTLSVLDVTDKSSIKVLSKTSYTGASFTHQGCFTEDMKFLNINDETASTASGSWNIIFNIEKLDAPKFVTNAKDAHKAVNHNCYTVGNRAYQASYSAGLRIRDASQIPAGKIVDVGFFDTAPTVDSGMGNTWMILRPLRNGAIPVGNMGIGLYLLKPTGPAVGAGTGPFPPGT